MKQLPSFSALFLLAATSSANATPQFTTSVHQYAAKAVCAFDDELAESGIFGIQSTIINLHNPYYENTRLRWKLASAPPDRQGEISDFVDIALGPDGATRIDCNMINELGEASNALENGAFEGFVVIQSQSELDVTSFHYAGQKETVQSIEVETYNVRKIEAPGRIFQCHNGVVPLSPSTSWTSPQGAVQFANQGSVHITGVPWMTLGGTGADLSRLPAGFYFFELEFCLCEEGEATVAVNSFRADNMAQSFLDGQVLTPSVTNNFSGGAAATGTLSVAPTAGQHQLLVFARNFATSQGGNTRFGVAMDGTLTFQNGYLGRCN